MTEAELKWIPSAGVGDIWKALERGGIDELVEILNSAVPTVTTESSEPISSSSSLLRFHLHAYHTWTDPTFSSSNP